MGVFMFPISTQASVNEDQDKQLWWIGFGLAAAVVCAGCAMAWQAIERFPLVLG
jgi:hypothetical protein